MVPLTCTILCTPAMLDANQTKQLRSESGVLSCRDEGVGLRWWCTGRRTAPPCQKVGSRQHIPHWVRDGASLWRQPGVLGIDADASLSLARSQWVQLLRSCRTRYRCLNVHLVRGVSGSGRPLGLPVLQRPRSGHKHGFGNVAARVQLARLHHPGVAGWLVPVAGLNLTDSLADCAVAGFVPLRRSPSNNSGEWINCRRH